MTRLQVRAWAIGRCRCLAGELNYVGFGRAYSGINYADTDGVGVSASGFLPIPVVDLYGRLGLVDWRTDCPVCA